MNKVLVLVRGIPGSGEGNGLYPIDMSEILSIMRDRPIKSLFSKDHHEIVENYK